MVAAGDVIAVAQGEVGYRGGSDGSSKFGAWYGLNPDPWCSMFLAWCADQAAQRTKTTGNVFAGPGMAKGYAYTPDWADNFRQLGVFNASSPGIKPGDIVFFDKIGANRISHVGIVTTADGAGYNTVEGNTFSQALGVSKTVAIHHYDHAYAPFRGYGRPAYAGGAATLAPSTPGSPGPVAPLTPSYVAPPPHALIPLRGLQMVTGEGALALIRISGTRTPTAITGRVTKAAFTFASTELSTLELTVQDTPEALIAASGVFARDYQSENFGRPVDLDFGDQHMQVTAFDAVPGQGGPLLNVTALSYSVRELNSWDHKGQTVFGQVAPSAWVKDMCANVGARAVVEPAFTTPVSLIRNPGQTTWEVMQQLAKAVGAVCYEHDNTIFFGRPTWLAANAALREWHFEWWAWDRYSPGLQGMPTVQTSLDDSNADVLSFGLLSADRWSARPGDVVHFDSAIRSQAGTWLMDKVEMNLRNSEVVQVTCGRPVDPTPEPPTTPPAGAPLPPVPPPLQPGVQ